jgi:SAM-dependent methyltransferase
VTLFRAAKRVLKNALGLGRPFPGSARYWEERYARGGTSGPGSYGVMAAFKADFLNAFVRQHDIRSVIEFGCGDGNQLSLARYEEYYGLDVSERAIELCRRRFAGDASKRFGLMHDYRGERLALGLSLDVVFHLVEDDIFHHYMRVLFAAATRYVIIYAADQDVLDPGPHVRHRRFSPWVAEQAQDWRLAQHVPNRYPWTGDPRTGTRSEFFVYAIR